MTALSDLLRLLRRDPRAPRRAGQTHVRGDTARDHRARLLARLTASAPDASAALSLIAADIEAIPDPAERRHIETHVVRFLQTYLMVPQGPGRVADIGGPSIHNTALAALKHWEVDTVAILSIDYERDLLPIDDTTLDGVLLCEVIEHFVLDPLHCLIEINRVLKPGGFVVITTPNAASWFSVHQALRQRPPNRWPVYSGDPAKARNHIHAREYLLSELEALVHAAGFGVEAVTTRDYGIAPEFCRLPGYPAQHRGETIFLRARKEGAPRKRHAPPVYAEDTPYAPARGAGTTGGEREGP